MKSALQCSLVLLCAIGCKKASTSGEQTGDGRAPQELRVCAADAADAGSSADAGAGSCSNVCTGLLPSQGWNSAGVDVGAVAAVIETDEQQIFFGAQGVTVFSGGVVTSNDATHPSWLGAAQIAATDGRGLWPAGVEASGEVWRVVTDGSLESVSDRFGLLNDAVKGLSPLGGAFTAFALDGQLAISDGTTLTRHDVQVTSLVGAQGKAAWVQGDVVHRYDPVADRLESWSLPGARLVALSSDGRLLASTAAALYAEAGTENLNFTYSTGGAAITSLVASGTRVWFTFGGRLGYVEQSQLVRSSGAAIEAGAALAPAAGGGVWALTSTGPQRFAAGGGELAAWQQTVLPVFARVCSSCHLPGGAAGISLASFEQWKAELDNINQRVVQQSGKPMPPLGATVTLTDAERDTIRCWVASGG